MVGGMGNGLMKTEAMLGGEETVAGAARPFCRRFLRSNANSNCAVSILLVPVEIVDVILCCLHEEDGSLDLLCCAFPLLWRGIGNLGNYVLEEL